MTCTGVYNTLAARSAEDIRLLLVVLRPAVSRGLECVRHHVTPVPIINFEEGAFLLGLVQRWRCLPPTPDSDDHNQKYSQTNDQRDPAKQRRYWHC